MNQITAEELQNLRESIKEGDYLTLDGSYEDMISFEVRVERSGKRYDIANLNEGIENAVTGGNLREYKLYLDVVDHDQGETVADVAYMELYLVSYKLSYAELSMYIDENGDTNNTLQAVIGLDEMHMSDECEDYIYVKYPSAAVNIAELHTCYVSPEFRGLGIVDYLYKHLNDFLYAEFNQIIYLMGIFINPFKEQKALVDIEMEHVPYRNDFDESDELIQSMKRSLERNNFHSFKNDTRHYYKNMLDDDSYEYYC